MKAVAMVAPKNPPEQLSIIKKLQAAEIQLSRAPQVEDLITGDGDLLGVEQMFLGHTQRGAAFPVRTIEEVRAAMAQFASGEGWHVRLTVPSSVAQRLGIWSTIGGFLVVDGEYLAEGSVLP